MSHGCPGGVEFEEITRQEPNAHHLFPACNVTKNAERLIGPIPNCLTIAMHCLHARKLDHSPSHNMACSRPHNDLQHFGDVGARWPATQTSLYLEAPVDAGANNILNVSMYLCAGLLVGYLHSAPSTRQGNFATAPNVEQSMHWKTFKCKRYRIHIRFLLFFCSFQPNITLSPHMCSSLSNSWCCM